MRVSSSLKIGIVTLVALAGSLDASPASAQAAQHTTLFEAPRTSNETFGNTRPVFDDPSPAFAQGTSSSRPGRSTRSSTMLRQIGLGIRYGGFTFGYGGTARYFFLNRLGVQFDYTRLSPKFGANEFTTDQFSPSIVFRFAEQFVSDAPISLIPYMGGGASILRSSARGGFTEDIRQALEKTNSGAVVFIGFEVFFDHAPRFGISGEVNYNTNDDVMDANLGGQGATISGHFYFR